MSKFFRCEAPRPHCLEDNWAIIVPTPGTAAVRPDAALEALGGTAAPYRAALVNLHRGMLVSFASVESSKPPTRNHPLRRLRNLPRSSGSECSGNFEAASNLQHRDNIVRWNSCDQPESGGCEIYSSLCVVEWIRLIRAARCQGSRELGGVFTVGKFPQNPCPIMF